MSAIQPATEPGPAPAKDRLYLRTDLLVALAVLVVALLVYLATAALGRHLAGLEGEGAVQSFAGR